MMDNNGEFYSFNESVKLCPGDEYQGELAIRKTFPWQIHIAGIMKAGLYKEKSGFSLLKGIQFNSDEYITRRLLFEGRTLVSGKSKYFYRANPNSTTKKKHNIKSFQQLDVNELIISYLKYNNIFDLAELISKNQKYIFKKLIADYKFSEENEKNLKIIDEYRAKYDF
jgi:hypothetical protein